MATLSDILSARWAGQEWSMTHSDNYDTLVWIGPGPKPAEATIRALANEVDAAQVAAASGKRKQDRLLAQSDALLDALDILAEFCLHEVAAKLRTTATTAPLKLNRLQTLVERINRAKAD